MQFIINTAGGYVDYRVLTSEGKWTIQEWSLRQDQNDMVHDEKRDKTFESFEETWKYLGELLKN